MSWKGDLIRAGIHSDGSNINIWRGNLTVYGSLTFTGGIEIEGDVVFDDKVTVQGGFVLEDGRVATGVIAGSAIDIDATTWQYSEGVELRYTISDWDDVYTLTSFRGVYLRAQNDEANGAGSIYGMECYGVTTVELANIWGALFYGYVKGATAVEVDRVYGIQTEVSWDAGGLEDTLTVEATPILAKVTSGNIDDYTKIHGMIIRMGDMAGGSRTFGSGIKIEDDGDMSGTSSFTYGLNVAIGCTNAVLIAGATTDAIKVSGTPTNSDILLHNGATIMNGAAGTLDITEATITLVGSTAVTMTTGAFTVQPAAAGNAVFNLKADSGAHLTVTQTNGAGVTFLSTSDGTAGFLFDGGIVTLDGGAILDNTTSADILNVTEGTITLTGATKINLDGPTDVTGILTVDTAGSPADGIKINAATPTDGLEISSACGSHAINISTAQTGAGITIASTCGTYGLNIAGACSTAGIALATGSVTGISIAAPTTTGISMVGGASYNPIHIGVKSDAADAGLIMVGATDDTGGVMIFADDGGDALGSITSPIWTRYVLTANQSGGATATGMFAQLKSYDTRVYTTGSYSAFKAYNQAGTVTLATGAEYQIINAGATLAGAMTVPTGTTFYGVDINLGGAGTSTPTGDGKIAGLCIRDKAEGAVWTNGIYMPGTHTTGINMPGTMTTGISISGAITNAISITTTGSAATDGHCLKIGSSDLPISTAAQGASAVRVYSDLAHASYWHVGSWFRSQLASTGTGSVYALRGEANLKDDVSTTGTCYVIGVHGRWRAGSGTGTFNGSGSCGAGVYAQWIDGGTYSAGSVACALWVDCQNTKDLSAIGHAALLYMSHNGNSTGKVVSAIELAPGSQRVTNLLTINETDTGLVSANVSGAPTIGNYRLVRVVVGGATHYLIAAQNVT